MLSVSEVKVGDRVRFNARACEVAGITKVRPDEYVVEEVIPCRNYTQARLTGADGWAHLSDGSKYVSLALLDATGNGPTKVTPEVPK